MTCCAGTAPARPFTTAIHAHPAPREIVHSKIEWRRLGLDLRKALEEQPQISKAQAARRKACHGFSIGEVTKDCEVYDRAFMDEIIRYVEAGGKICRAPRAYPSDNRNLARGRSTQPSFWLDGLGPESLAPI